MTEINIFLSWNYFSFQLASRVPEQKRKGENVEILQKMKFIFSPQTTLLDKYSTLQHTIKSDQLLLKHCDNYLVF